MKKVLKGDKNIVFFHKNNFLMFYVRLITIKELSTGFLSAKKNALFHLLQLSVLKEHRYLIVR